MAHRLMISSGRVGLLSVEDDTVNQRARIALELKRMSLSTGVFARKD